MESLLRGPSPITCAPEPLLCGDMDRSGHENVDGIATGFRCKPQFRIRSPISKRRLLKAIQSQLMQQPRKTWKSMKPQDTERGGAIACAFAAAAAAATFGFSLSMPYPAIADSTSSAASWASSVESRRVIDDTGAQLSPEQMLALNAELRNLRLIQNGSSSERTDKGEDGLNVVSNSGDLILMEGKSSMAFTPSITVPSMKDTCEAPGQDAGASLVKTTAVFIRGNRGPSDMVAVAAVGSVTSAASLAGTVVSQSSDSLQHVVAIPGARLLARALQHLGGGGVAGAIGASVVYPLDTIKTRMQAQASKDGEEPQYKDELDCFTQLVLEEGPRSLYSGLVPQLLGIAPEKALKLTVNEILLEMLEQLLPGTRLWALELIAGGGGGFSQVLVTNPMEIVKLRLQMQSKIVSPKGLWQVVKDLGLQGLYCGSAITLARDVPSSGIFFACYAFITQLYPEHKFWAGFLAAIPATILVTPFDVIKTRMQMETPPGEEPYRNAWHCCTVLLQREGPRGLFKGGLIRVLRTSPQFGITLMLYSLFCNGS